MAPLLLAAGLLTMGGLLIAALAGGGRLARFAAWATVLALPLAPLVFPESDYVARCAVTLAGAMALVKGTEVVLAGGRMEFPARLAHLFVIHDTRSARPAVPGAWIGLVVTAAPFFLLFAAAAWVVWSPAAEPPGPIRWGAGIVGLYCLFEVVDRLGRAPFAAAGVAFEPAQHTPIAARTLSDFWGNRWNGLVQRWIVTMAVRPVVRRRGGAGPALAAGFGLSAVLHVGLVVFVLPAADVVSFGGFFLLQGALVAAERALGVARWPSLLGRAWTFVGLLLPAPLFMEPLLHALGR